MGVGVGYREELKLCTSASPKDGAGVADDRANLDCIVFTFPYMATSSKPVVGDSFLIFFVIVFHLCLIIRPD